MVINNATKEKWKSHVEQTVQAITDKIREQMSDYDVKSVYWTGGFSKGEYSFIEVDGTLMPYGDYDFYLIVNRSVPPKKIAAVTQDIHQELKLDINLDISVLCYKDLKSLAPDRSNIDLKVGKLMWGEPCLSLISLEASDIPSISSFRIIFNRLIVLLSVTTPDLFGNRVSQRESIDIRMLCDKLYLDIAVTFLLITNQYKPESTTRERLETLRQNDLIETTIISRTAGLYNRIADAVANKERPGSIISNDLASHCRQAFFDGLLVLKHLLGCYTPRSNVDINTQQLSHLIQKELPRHYYREYLAKSIEQMFGAWSVYLLPLKLASRLTGLYENVYWRLSVGSFKGFGHRYGRLSPIIVCMAAAVPLMATTPETCKKEVIGQCEMLTRHYVGRDTNRDSTIVKQWTSEKERITTIWHGYTRRYRKRTIRSALADIVALVFHKRDNDSSTAETFTKRAS